MVTERKKIENKLDREQKEALWDAYRPAFRTKIEGRASETLPKDMPIREISDENGINIQSSSVE